MSAVCLTKIPYTIGVKRERAFFACKRQFNYRGKPIWRQTVNFQSLFFGEGVRVVFTQRPPFLFFSLFPPYTLSPILSTQHRGFIKRKFSNAETEYVITRLVCHEDF